MYWIISCTSSIKCNNTPASIAAGKYFKIQYIHSKKKVKKKAINARYNNKVISTKFQDILKVLLLCILHTGSSVTVLLLEQNIHIQVPKKSYITTKFSKACDDFKQQNSYLEWEEIHPSICTSKNPLYRKRKNYIMVPGDIVAKN